MMTPAAATPRRRRPPGTLCLVSLGCAKNQVDSELMLGRLRQAGWVLTERPEEAQVIVVNTCSFIEDAAQESLETILELARYKKSGCCRRLVVTGCLPERYREKIVPELPEVDLFLGTGALDRIVEAVGDRTGAPKAILPDPDTLAVGSLNAERVLTSPHTAYLKIAEGCDRGCTFCIIPRLRGRQKSRPPEDILAEGRDLVDRGVKELNLVAQDTTHYGRDLDPPVPLAALLHHLAGACGGARREGLWIRVLYGHPESIDEAFIRAVAALPAVCPYFDLPIQHASDRVLRRMGRNYTRQGLRRLFRRIREIVPDACLRTTVITGFPGETECDFQQVLDFAEEIRFDHLGAFVYSDAEDLPSHRLPNAVPRETAQERYDRLLSLQLDIAAEKNQRHIGRRMTVLIEEDLGNGMFSGRTALQAPEVDGVTYVQARPGVRLPLGGFVAAHIRDVMEYDLLAEAP